jgi:hypothetical protein
LILSSDVFGSGKVNIAGVKEAIRGEGGSPALTNQAAADHSETNRV